MIIDLSCASNDERIQVLGPRIPALEMACDILLAVMEYEGDGTVETYDDNQVPPSDLESFLETDFTGAMDRILTWMLDDEEDRAALTDILSRFQGQKPGGWDAISKFLTSGVIHIREGGHDDEA